MEVDEGEGGSEAAAEEESQDVGVKPMQGLLSRFSVLCNLALWRPRP